MWYRLVLSSLTVSALLAGSGLQAAESSSRNGYAFDGFKVSVELPAGWKAEKAPGGKGYGFTVAGSGDESASVYLYAEGGKF